MHPKYALTYSNVARLCYDINHATNPAALRTAREHARMSAWTTALRARLSRIGAVEGSHYIENDHSGRLSPLPNFPCGGRIS